MARSRAMAGHPPRSPARPRVVRVRPCRRARAFDPDVRGGGHRLLPSRLIGSCDRRPMVCAALPARAVPVRCGEDQSVVLRPLTRSRMRSTSPAPGASRSSAGGVWGKEGCERAGAARPWQSFPARCPAECGSGDRQQQRTGRLRSAHGDGPGIHLPGAVTPLQEAGATAALSVAAERPGHARSAVSRGGLCLTDGVRRAGRNARCRWSRVAMPGTYPGRIGRRPNHCGLLPPRPLAVWQATDCARRLGTNHSRAPARAVNRPPHTAGDFHAYRIEQEA